MTWSEVFKSRVRDALRNRLRAVFAEYGHVTLEELCSLADDPKFQFVLSTVRLSDVNQPPTARSQPLVSRAFRGMAVRDVFAPPKDVGEEIEKAMSEAVQGILDVFEEGR